MSIENKNQRTQESEIQNDDFFDYDDFDPSTLKNFINKKTQRGRKTKCPLPKNVRCSICLEFEEYSKEKLSYCSVCQAPLHLNCYHLPIKDHDHYLFTCERCKEAIQTHSDIKNYSCFICGESDGILCKNHSTGKFYHSICLRLIPELYENLTSMDKVCRENIRKWRYKNSCKYCQQRLSKNKAVLKCGNPKCKDYYHIPCAIEKGMIFSTNYLYKYYSLNQNNSIPFFCSCHNKRLAAAYRKDVIFSEKIYDDANNKQENDEFDLLGPSKTTSTSTFNNDFEMDFSEKDDEDNDDFCFQRKESRNRRKMSYESTTEDYSSSVVGGDTYEEKFDKFERTGSNEIVDKFEECFANLPSKINALDLDFNKIPIDDNENKNNVNDQHNEINNISPKEKIPLEFIYGSIY